MTTQVHNAARELSCSESGACETPCADHCRTVAILAKARIALAYLADHRDVPPAFRELAARVYSESDPSPDHG